MQNKVLNFLNSLKVFCLAGYLFICPLLFLTDTTQNPYIIQQLFLSIAGGIFILAFAAQVWFTKEVNLKFSLLDLGLVAFLFSLIASLFFNYFGTVYKAALIQEFARKSDYLFALVFGFLFAKFLPGKIEINGTTYNFLKNIFIWCLFWFLWKVQAGAFIAILIFSAGLYFCFLHLKNGSIKQAADLLLAACFCSCLYGIMQTLGFELFWTLNISKEFGARPVSTFGNPNFLASFTLLFLPYSLLLFFKAKIKKEIFISGFTALVLILFLALSGTRSAWLGLLGAGIIFLIFSRTFRQIFVLNHLKLFAFLIIFIFCFYGLNLSLKYGGVSAPKARIAEVKQVLKLKDISLQNKEFIHPLHQRLMMWHCAFEGFKNSPFFGKGANSFQQFYPFCQGKLIKANPALDKIKMQANAVHNEYLEILFEGGLFAFISYVLLLVLFFISVIRKLRDLNEDYKYFYLALLFGLLSVLFDNIFNITLRTFLTAFAFWFLFSAVNNLFVKTKKISVYKGTALIIFVLIFCFVSFIVFVQAKQFTAQKYELKGYKYLVTNNLPKAAEEMANSLKFSAHRPEVYYTLINAYIELNNFKKAEELTLEALKFYPAYYEFYFRLAALQNAQNEQKEALENLRNNLLLLPTYTPAAELFANILSNTSNPSKKDKYLLEDLIHILPFDTNLPSYLAEIYFKENDCHNAAPLALKTLQINIFDKTALNILAVCPVSGQEKILNRAVQINNLKGRLKIKRDEYLQKEIMTLVKQNPGDFEVNSLLAEFYFTEQDFCKAAETMKQGKPKGSIIKSYNFAFALAAQKCGNFQEAKSLLEEILYLDPYDEFAKNRLKNVNI